MRDPNGEAGKDPMDAPSTVHNLSVPRPLTASGPEGPAHLILEVVGGPLDGLRRRIAAPTATIGRASDNDVILAADPMVSARHATVVQEQGQCWIEDLGSRNGVYLGTQRINGRVPWQPGALVRLGRTTLELLSS